MFMSSLNENFIQIKNFAKQNMVSDFLHGWSHIERVLKNAELVNKEMNGDWEIIYCAVISHDIGHNQDSKKHHIISAEMINYFLKLMICWEN